MYCSKECQKQHWSSHKIICSKWKWRRFDKFITHFISSSKLKRNWFLNLSADVLGVDTKVRPETNKIETRGIAALPGVIIGIHSICALCEELVNKNGPYNAQRFEFSDIQIEYYRCFSCCEKHFILDKYTLMDPRELKYYLLLCIQSSVACKLISYVPRDVRKLICSYVSI